MITVRQLGRQMGVDRKEVKGVVIALGLRMERLGSSDCLTDADAERVRQVLEAWRRTASGAVGASS